MRKLLIPLLAALALPTAVNAERHWLIISHGVTRGGLEKIQMASSEDCVKEGIKWKNSTTHNIDDYSKKFHCIKGK